jgi:hypothetical protein
MAKEQSEYNAKGQTQLKKGAKVDKCNVAVKKSVIVAEKNVIAFEDMAAEVTIRAGWAKEGKEGIELSIVLGWYHN